MGAWRAATGPDFDLRKAMRSTVKKRSSQGIRCARSGIGNGKIAGQKPEASPMPQKTKNNDICMHMHAAGMKRLLSPSICKGLLQ
jgi:hypothetical protein